MSKNRTINQEILSHYQKFSCYPGMLSEAVTPQAKFKTRRTKNRKIYYKKWGRALLIFF